MMYHAALPQQKQLRRQLFIVAVDLADHIASIRTRGRSGRFRDLIVAIVGPLFLIDQRPLNVDSFDLPLEDIGIGADLGQLFPPGNHAKGGKLQRCNHCCRCYLS